MYLGKLLGIACSRQSDSHDIRNSHREAMAWDLGFYYVVIIYGRVGILVTPPPSQKPTTNIK